ncbi:MAG: MauE/DoxX family redox-associated membrane protein [Candidatus Aminicenantia bacterium]
MFWDNKYSILIFRLIVGGVFIFSAIAKIIQPLGFAQDISNYQLFSQDIAFFSALILPWIELLCGLSLISGIAIRGSSFLISGMLIFFITILIITLLQGKQIDCGCFGFFSHPVSWSLVVQDGVLFFLSLSIFFYSLKHSFWPKIKISH